MLKHSGDVSTDVTNGIVVSSLADVMSEAAEVVSSPTELTTADVVSFLADVMTTDVIPSPVEARMLTAVVRFSGHVNGNLAGK